MRRIGVLAGPTELECGDIAVFDPSAQDLAGRQRADEDRGERTQGAGGFGVAQDEVIARDECSIAGEVATERARAIGEDRPAGELGKLAESRGAFVAIFEGMRSDHDDTAFGLWEQAGDCGGRERRADDAAGRHGGERLKIEASRCLEAFFSVGRGERVAEGQIEVHRTSQRALRALPGVDQELAPMAEEGEVGAGYGGLGGPDGVAAEDSVLGNGLARVAFAQFGRTVGGQDEQGRGCEAGLDDGGQVVGSRGAGGAEQGGGLASGLSDA